MLLLQIKLLDLFGRVRDREEGQGLVEYALILSLVVIGAVAALALIGGGVKSTLNHIASKL